MREFEMRQRIEGFLKRRMQGMLPPALGLGLALGGCGDWGGMEYMAQFPRDADAAGVFHDAESLDDDATIASDGAGGDALASKDTLRPGTDGARDVASIRDVRGMADAAQDDVAMAMDAARDSAGEAGASVDAVPGVDAGADMEADLGVSPVKYMAQIPDAGSDLGPVVRYMAQLPLG